MSNRDGWMCTGEHLPHSFTLGIGKVFVAGEEVYGEGHDKGDEARGKEEIDICFPAPIILVQSNCQCQRCGEAKK